MNSVSNVAVFPCGSEVGLEVSRALKYSPHFQLFGWNSVPDYGRIEYTKYIEDIPWFEDQYFIPKIQKYISKLEIDFLIPGMDEVGFLLKKNEHVLNCQVVYAKLETARILRRKSSMYEQLHGLVNTPKVYESFEAAASALPVFSKPDIGYGSKNAEKILTANDLRKAWDTKENILTEYLPGAEYTVDCFTDLGGNVLFAEARQRKRVRMGISVSSLPTSVPYAKEWAQILADKLQMKGAWFFQVKENIDSEPTLLEVASRVSGSMSMFRGSGVNFIMLDLYQRMGKEISILPTDFSQGYLERALDCKVTLPLDFETVYVDLDDCLVIHGEVNTSLVSFLYKSINQKCKVVLLTRHDGDLDKYLKQLRLTKLFDEVVHINNRDTPKSDYIIDESSIFIDDSFSERKEVQEVKNIPVFAPDAIAVLA